MWHFHRFWAFFRPLQSTQPFMSILQDQINQNALNRLSHFRASMLPVTWFPCLACRTTSVHPSCVSVVHWKGLDSAVSLGKCCIAFTWRIFGLWGANIHRFWAPACLLWQKVIKTATSELGFWQAAINAEVFTPWTERIKHADLQSLSELRVHIRSQISDVFHGFLTFHRRILNFL